MRTKTSILSAVALAAGLATASAQVYSANIVGYVNTVIAGDNNYTLIANPLLGSQGGVSTNGALSVMPSLVGGETLLAWNGSGYYSYVYNPGAQAGGFPSDWTDGGLDSIPGRIYNASADLYFASTQPDMPQGKGFFILNPNPTYTNTFVGTVVLSNTVPISVAGDNNYSMLAAVAPISGNASGVLPFLGMPLVGGETVMNWNGSGYNSYVYNPGAQASGFPSDWTDGGLDSIPGRIYNASADLFFSPTTNGPPVQVGGGFFMLNPNPTYNWTQSLTVQ